MEDETLGTGFLMNTMYRGEARRERASEGVNQSLIQIEVKADRGVGSDTVARHVDVRTTQTPKSTYLNYRESEFGHREGINTERSSEHGDIVRTWPAS